VDPRTGLRLPGVQVIEIIANSFVFFRMAQYFMNEKLEGIWKEGVGSIPRFDWVGGGGMRNLHTGFSTDLRTQNIRNRGLQHCRFTKQLHACLLVTHDSSREFSLCQLLSSSVAGSSEDGAMFFPPPSSPIWETLKLQSLCLMQHWSAAANAFTAPSSKAEATQ
jgi:hypothetical protein